MKSIGILTYHSYNNYGAVLQAYALQHFISQSIDPDVEVIDFYTANQQEDNSIFQLKSRHTLRDIAIALLFKLPIYTHLKKRKQRFDSFRSDFLNMTERFDSVSSLFNKLPHKDIYITGSDQVFNPLSQYAEVYYLGFEKNGGRKVAYAPSFGLSNMQGFVNKRLQDLLTDFDSISCREQSGSIYLTNLLGRTVPCVADPVFLLTRSEWDDIAIKPSLVKGNEKGYIFVYRLNGGQPLMSLANKVSDATGLPIICVALNRRYVRNSRMYYSAGPQELLGLIRDASYIVTDSFHGTALALVYNKKVIPYIASPKTAARITTIMDKLGLSQNVVYDVTDFCFEKLVTKDYQDQLKAFIKSSESFLRNALV